MLDAICNQVLRQRSEAMFLLSLTRYVADMHLTPVNIVFAEVIHFRGRNLI